MNGNQPEYIIIGTITAPWGYEGHCKVTVETDFPQRFSPGARVYVNGSQLTIEAVDWHKGRAIVKFENIDSEKAVENLRDRHIEIPHSQLTELSKDEYYHFQLIGLTVKTTGGDTVGELTDILPMSSADVYVITGKSGEILVPAIDDVIKSVDLASGVLTIEPIDGLLDLNEKKPKQKQL